MELWKTRFGEFAENEFNRRALSISISHKGCYRCKILFSSHFHFSENFQFLLLLFCFLFCALSNLLNYAHSSVDYGINCVVVNGCVLCWIDSILEAELW